MLSTNHMKKFGQTAISVAFATTVALGIADKAHAVVLGSPLTGTYNVGRTAYHFTDYNRQEIFTPDKNDYRELMVQVFYPTKTVASEVSAPYIEDNVVQKLEEEIIPIPGVGELLKSVKINAIPEASVARTQSEYPVLLFSHGLRELPAFYTSFAEQLVSHGYVVTTVSHSYDALATVFPDGRFATINNSPLAAIGNPDVNFDIQQQLSAQATQVRAADAQFVLNELNKLNANDPNNLLAGKLDLDQVGIFGHSTGGATAAEAMRLDNRFKAGINMDGTLWTDVVNTGLNQPFMLMNGDNSYNSDPRMETFYKNLNGDKYHLVIKDADHQNFSDKSLLISQYGFPDYLFNEIGIIDPNISNEIINAYTLAFFNKYLKNVDAPLLGNRVSDKLVDFTPQPKSIPEPTLPAEVLGLFSLYCLCHRQRSKAEI